MADVNKIFNEFIDAKPLFSQRQALTLNFTPETIPHRDKEIETIGRMLAPALKGGRPSNLFIYGKTGTGKTLSALYVAKELEKAGQANGVKIRHAYVNCKMGCSADTEYRLFAHLLKEFGVVVPCTGLPKDKLYQEFYDLVDKEKQIVILIMDEIDALIKKTGDEVLYSLTRKNQSLKNASICMIGITNDLNFIDSLEPRVRSSLGEEELVFPPYNALQLQDILRQRCSAAFNEGVLVPGVIEKCAALAAQEHGDARRALELLRVAGELAERSGAKQVTTANVDVAQEKIDVDRVVEIVKAQPRQSQAILYSIISLSEKEKNIETGGVFAVYENLCRTRGIKPLTERRVSDLIAEFDMFGIITMKVVSKGRYGRTRVINLNLNEQQIQKVNAVMKEVF